MTAGFGDLHAMNPTGRFSDRASDYRRYRPDYPTAAIDAILRDLGDPARLVAADVGAGTGISSRLLAARAVRVIAVEPNAAMRAAADPHPGVEWRDGTGEATGLPAASVDLVVSAQAFHWFRDAEALAEFHRILRPGGRLALMWNDRDPDDALTRSYGEAIRVASGDHPAELRTFDPSVVAAGGHFAAPRLESFPHCQSVDLAGFIGRATSASYVPRDGSALELLLRTLEALFNRHRDAEGHAALRYVTRVYLSERT
jgi:SAM-dependent methyltransferase